MIRRILSIVLCLLVIGTAQTGSPVVPENSRNELLDVTPMRDLFHLMNTIIEENPGYRATLSRLSTMEESARKTLLHDFSQRNADNPRISKEVDALLATPAYQLYYQQFRTANPDSHRRLFFALPYTAADAPGGVGDHLLELCRHLEQVEVWYNDAISQVNLDRCISVAREWLPPGQYVAPKTYFIYDGMGDAFARDGMVCFDLRGVILSKRPQESRFENLAEIGTDQIERVLAHEFHHSFSEKILFAKRREESSWQASWKDRIIRGLVSEGVAMQCDPRVGLEKAVRQDTVVIRHWIREINEKFAALDEGTTSDSAIYAWWESSFHARAEALRNEFLARRFPTYNLDSLAHLTQKPDLKHTLGWWMVSQISDSEKHREAVIQLLSEPESLFTRYNTAIGPGEPSLLIAIEHLQ